MILKALEVDLLALRKVIEASISNNDTINSSNANHLELKKQAAKAVKLANLELMVFKKRRDQNSTPVCPCLKDPDVLSLWR